SSNVYGYSISPALPSGLVIDLNTGEISGTPTELWNQTSYMVWANNSGGSSMAYLNITVNDQVPTLSYSPENLILTVNTASTDLPLNANLTGPGAIVSWTINASLPSGLTFGTNNGTIYGTPTELWNQTSYMIRLSNSGGSSMAYLNITVNDQVPTLSYSPVNLTLTNN
ncbi:MAG: putative Ig domain-containing protein, partial [Candidatus Poseidonia sp.]|nr:putative Ig domain-containing protein [Poseidonia sp.]